MDLHFPMASNSGQRNGPDLMWWRPKSESASHYEIAR